MIRNRDMNSGYDGYRMSKRASEAYRNGEKPLSRWTKKEIVSLSGDERMAGYPLSVLRKYFLYQSSWHHTSRYANKTDFFAISEDAIRNIDINELDRLAEEDRKQRQASATEKPKKAIISYGEWEGTRSHPRLVMREEYAIVIGRWAYLESGKRKDLTGRHVESCRAFERAPRGTASVFRNIEKAMEKKRKKRKL